MLLLMPHECAITSVCVRTAIHSLQKAESTYFVNGRGRESKEEGRSWRVHPAGSRSTEAAPSARGRAAQGKKTPPLAVAPGPFQKKVSLSLGGGLSECRAH